MAIQLGSAYGKVQIDASGVSRGVNSATASLTKLSTVAATVGTSMKSLGNAMTIGLTLPILAVGTASIKAASDYEETKNKAVVVFGDMADAIVENSNRAALTLGMSKQQYLDYAASIGAALTAGGMGINEATALAEGAVKHFADLASFHNARVEDVAVAWQSAIRGQYEPIQRYFPFINDAYLKTYGTANGLIDANTKQLTANQRAIILNAIALDENLNPALDDFAETSDGLANSARTMQAQLNDALVMLGENLLPLALNLVDGLNKLLTAFNNLPSGLQKALVIFAASLALLGPVLSFVGTIITAISGIAGLIGTLATMGVSLTAFVGVLGTAGSALVGFAAAALTVVGPILLIVGALALLYWAFKSNFGGIRTTAEQLWFIIKYYFREGWKWLRETNNEALAQMGAGLAEGFRALQERFAGFVDWLRNLWGRVRDFLVNTFRGVNWHQIGQFLMSGLANGIIAGIPTIVAAATRAAQAALQALKKALDSRSPSRKTMIEGLHAAQGFILGMDRGMNSSRLAHIAERPVVEAANSMNQSITMNFANGVTIRQVQQMLELNNEQLLAKLNAALGGV